MSTVISSVTPAERARETARHQRVTLITMLYTVWAMIRRDVLVSIKQFHTTLVLLLIQPAMLLLALGRIQEFTGGIPAAFASVLLPGILGTVLVSVSIQSVSGPLIAEFSYTLEIEDRLLSPVPVWLVGVEKIFVGMLKAWACAALYFPLAWLILGPALYHPIFSHPWLFLAALAFSALLMSALGLLLGSVADGPRSNIIFAVLLVPMSFLGCVFFSWQELAQVPVLQYLTLLDPQTYISELLRGTITTQPHMSYLWAWLALGGWSVLFTALGLRAFIRRAIN
jgi:ABC-2 type transport system permease protein